MLQILDVILDVKGSKLFRAFFLIKGAVGVINLRWCFDEGDQDQNELACFLACLLRLLPCDVRFN